MALLSYNCPEFLEVIFAANYLGAIAMPINWRLAAPEVRYILEHSGASVIVCDQPLVDLADKRHQGLEQAPMRVSVSSVGASGWIALDDLRSDRHGVLASPWRPTMSIG